MKIALRMLTNGSVSGGAAKYLRHMIPLLSEGERIDELRIFLPKGALSDIPGDWPIVSWEASGRRGKQELRKALEAFAPDVIFIPTARHFSFGAVPVVTMVRNMEPLRTPFGANHWVDRIKTLARRFAAKKASQQGDRVIAVSDHVSEFLTERWSIPEARIDVVPHGVEAPSEPERPDALPDLGGKPFVFSMGSIRPARGLTDLIAAMGDKRLSPDLQMVFAGKVDKGAERYHREVMTLARQRGVLDRLHWVGHVGPAQTSWLFRNSDLFVMTSRVEACPNTVLEAMRHGCLSVSTDDPPMPEFFGDGALYYRAGDPVSLAKRMDVALNLPTAEARSYRNAAAMRADRFTWDRTAEATLAVLAKAVAG